MLISLAELSIGDGIAICGGLGSVLAVVAIVIRRKPRVDADELLKSADQIRQAAEMVACATAELSKAAVTTSDESVKQLISIADSMKVLADSVKALQNKFEDVVRLNADMEHTKASHANLKVRFDRLYDITHDAIRAMNMTGNNR